MKAMYSFKSHQENMPTIWVHDYMILSSNFMWEHPGRRFSQKHEVSLIEKERTGKCWYMPRPTGLPEAVNTCPVLTSVVQHLGSLYSSLTMDRCGRSGTGKETLGRWKAQDSPIWHWVQTSSPGYIVGESSIWSSGSETQIQNHLGNHFYHWLQRGQFSHVPSLFGNWYQDSEK